MSFFFKQTAWSRFELHSFLSFLCLQCASLNYSWWPTTFYVSIIELNWEIKLRIICYVIKAHVMFLITNCKVWNKNKSDELFISVHKKQAKYDKNKTSKEYLNNGNHICGTNILYIEKELWALFLAFNL